MQKKNGLTGGSDHYTGSSISVSRRRAMAASTAALAGLLCGSVLGQGQKAEVSKTKPPEDAGGAMARFRAHFKRMGSDDLDEREQMFREMNLRRRQRAIERYEDRLKFSEAEWQVIGPRLEAVYDLVHRSGGGGFGGGRPLTGIDAKKQELRAILREEGAQVDRIKAGLRAVRAAQERARQELGAARQSLRDLLTLRQEAELVLDGLLV